jgi:hypothetical protein
MVADRVLRGHDPGAGRFAFELRTRVARRAAAARLRGHRADPGLVLRTVRAAHAGHHTHRDRDGVQLRAVAVRARNGDPRAGAGADSAHGRAVRGAALHDPERRDHRTDATRRAHRGVAPARRGSARDRSASARRGGRVLDDHARRPELRRGAGAGVFRRVRLDAGRRRRLHPCVRPCLHSRRGAHLRREDGVVQPRRLGHSVGVGPVRRRKPGLVRMFAVLLVLEAGSLAGNYA